jgi:hypothetical protein
MAYNHSFTIFWTIWHHIPDYEYLIKQLWLTVNIEEVTNLFSYSLEYTENLGFHRGVAEVFAPLECCALLLHNLLCHFQATYWSHLRRSRCPRRINLDFMTFDDGTSTLSHNVNNKLQTDTTQNPITVKTGIYNLKIKYNYN